MSLIHYIKWDDVSATYYDCSQTSEWEPKRKSGAIGRK